MVKPLFFLSILPIIIIGSYGFTQEVYADPSLSISPTSGPAGTPVHATGSGFTLGSFVYIYFDGSNTGYGSTADSSGNIDFNFYVPISAVGDHTVAAIDPTTNQAPSQTFTVTTPTFSISPTSGPVGTLVHATGSGFAPSNFVYIYFDGSNTGYGSTADAAGNIDFNFYVPISAVGDHTVAAIDPTTNQAPSQTFTVTTPTFSISPTSGPVGTLVHATGSGFAPSNFVYIYFDGSNTGYGSTADSSGNIDFDFYIPASTVGDHTVQAIDGYNNQAPSQTFTVTTPTFSISPTSGPVGTLVHATGSGFAPSNFVYIYFDGSNTGYGSTADSSGNINFDFYIPASTVGDHTVQAIDPTTNQAPSQTFTVTTPTFSISPTSGPVGTLVHATGSGFTLGSFVYIYFDGSNTGYGSTADAAGNIDFNFYVPISAVGDHTVAAIDPTTNQAPSQTFTVTTPTFSISPTSGP